MQEQEYRGEVFRVKAPGYECRQCGFRVLGPGHLEVLCKATSDAYRLKHNLLTSAQIVERRKAMKMTQAHFAKFVGVGVASLKRWESGALVQDIGHDCLLRLRTDHVLFTKQIPSRQVTVIEVHADRTCQPEPAKQLTHVFTQLAQTFSEVFVHPAATSVPSQMEMIVNSNELALAA